MILHVGTYPRKSKTYVHTKTCAQIFISILFKSTLFIISKVEIPKLPLIKHPLIDK